jgi:hypothetical protein
MVKTPEPDGEFETDSWEFETEWWNLAEPDRFENLKLEWWEFEPNR